MKDKMKGNCMWNGYSEVGKCKKHKEKSVGFVIFEYNGSFSHLLTGYKGKWREIACEAFAVNFVREKHTFPSPTQRKKCRILSFSNIMGAFLIF